MLINYISFISLLFAVSLPLISMNKIDSLKIEANKQTDNTKKANLYIDIALSYMGSSIDSLKAYTLKAETISNVTSDSFTLARLYNLKGNLSRFLEKNDDALQLYLKALDLNRKIGNKKEQLNNLGNIGQQYHLVGDFKSSLEYAFEVFKLSKELNYKKGVALAYKDIAYSYFKLDSLDKALEFYSLSLGEFKKEDYKRGLGFVNLGIGEVYLKKKEPKKSVQHLLTSLSYFELNQDNYFLMIAYQYLGASYQELKQYHEANSYYFKSMNIAKLLGMQLDLKNALDGLALSYHYMGDYKNALLYNIKSDSIEDSLQIFNQAKALKEIDSKYKEKQAFIENNMLKEKMEKNKAYQYLLIIGIVVFIIVAIGLYIRFKEKSKINNQLKLKNDEINKINEQLEIANSTKDKFFSIIAHDLKGPLGSFKNLLTLMINSYDDFNDEERKEFLSSIDISSNDIYILLENLLDWSRSQRNLITIKPVEADFSIITDNIIQQLKNLANDKKITIKSNISKPTYLVFDPQLIQTVLRNLISNSLKFTHKNGSVNIDFYEDDKKATIIVADSGIGMNQEKLNKLFTFDNNKSTYGTDNEKGTGLGLLICKDFVELHNGKIWVESEVGVGSKFYFTIPKSIN